MNQAGSARSKGKKAAALESSTADLLPVERQALSPETTIEAIKANAFLLRAIMAGIVEKRESFEMMIGEVLDSAPAAQTLAEFFGDYLLYVASDKEEAMAVTEEAIGCGLVAGFILAKAAQASGVGNHC